MARLPQPIIISAPKIAGSQPQMIVRPLDMKSPAVYHGKSSTAGYQGEQSPMLTVATSQSAPTQPVNAVAGASSSQFVSIQPIPAVTAQTFFTLSATTRQNDPAALAIFIELVKKLQSYANPLFSFFTRRNHTNAVRQVLKTFEKEIREKSTPNESFCAIYEELSRYKQSLNNNYNIQGGFSKVMIWATTKKTLLAKATPLPFTTAKL